MPMILVPILVAYGKTQWRYYLFCMCTPIREPHFNVFINIYEYANEIICICDKWIKAYV